jgi:hypothetical protein
MVTSSSEPIAAGNRILDKRCPKSAIRPVNWASVPFVPKPRQMVRVTGGALTQTLCVQASPALGIRRFRCSDRVRVIAERGGHLVVAVTSADFQRHGVVLADIPANSTSTGGSAPASAPESESGRCGRVLGVGLKGELSDSRPQTCDRGATRFVRRCATDSGCSVLFLIRSDQDPSVKARSDRF